MTREDDNGATDSMIDDTASSKMKDKYYMTYFLFYALGTFTLVPSNFFTTATDYWMYKFRDTKYESVNSENRTELQAQFTSNYSIVSSVSNVFFLVVTIAFLRSRVSMVTRMIGSLCGAIAMFAITVVFVEIDTDSWQAGFFAITLTMGFFLTAFTAVFMVTLFELVARFPPGYLAAILSGQSICGIFAALVQIFSLSIGASSKTSGLVYFLVGMFFVFMTLVYLIISLKKSGFFTHFLYLEVETERPKITKEKMLSILDKIKFYMISMIIVLGCSIMIHPGVTSLVVSMEKGNGHKWNDVFYVAVTTFLFYNVFDYIGREFAGKFRKPTNGIVLMIMSVIRISFVPMLMLCNAQPRSHLPVVFNKDYAYIIIIIIFAFTNGYFINLCVIRVPSVTAEDEKTLATILILVFMVVILGACSFASPALIKAL